VIYQLWPCTIKIWSWRSKLISFFNFVYFNDIIKICDCPHGAHTCFYYCIDDALLIFVQIDSNIDSDDDYDVDDDFISETQSR